MEIIRRVFNDKKKNQSKCGYEGLFILKKGHRSYYWNYICSTVIGNPDSYLEKCTFEDLYVSINEEQLVRIPFKEEHLWT